MSPEQEAARTSAPLKLWGANQGGIHPTACPKCGTINQVPDSSERDRGRRFTCFKCGNYHEENAPPPPPPPPLKKCQRCFAERVVHVFGPVDDMGVVTWGKECSESYFPGDLGIGGGDDIEFSFCLECGQIQGDWPLKKTELEGAEPEGEDGLDGGDTEDDVPEDETGG